MKRRAILTLLSSISLAALTQGCTVWSNSADNMSALFAKSDKGWLALSDYDRGKHYIAVGDYGLAIDAFNAALAKNPKSVPAMNGLAIAYDRIGRGDVAKTFLAKALELDPRSADTLNNLAYLDLSHGERDEAAVYFARAKEALASVPPSEVSAKLATVVENNRALSTQAANARAQSGATTDAQQPAAAQIVAPGNATLDPNRAQPNVAQTEPVTAAPAPPRTGTGAFAAREPAGPQLVDSEIWNLQINGPEPKLIPPRASVARAVRGAAEPVGHVRRSPVAKAEIDGRKQMHAKSASMDAPLVVPTAAPIHAAAPSVAQTADGTELPVAHQPASQAAAQDVAHIERAQTKPIPTKAALASAAVVPAIQIQSDAPKPVGLTLAFQHQVTVRIANGTGRHNMAHRFQHYFGKLGVPVRHLVNVPADCRQSTIYYSRGQEKAADALAHLLPVSVRTIGLSNNYGVVELMLAPDLEHFDSTLIERRSS